jgi:exosortase
VTSTSIDRRGVLLALLVLGSIAMLFPEIRSLVALSSTDDSFSHLPVIPAISAFLLFSERDRLSGVRPEYDLRGLAVMLAGGALIAYSRTAGGALGPEIANAAAGLALVLAWTGSFALCFGFDALRKSPFPFLFLLFMVPLPDVLLDPVVGMLQRASAELANLFFRMTGVSFFREGTFLFSFPGLNIEVAKQCSGIRSSMSLFIVGVLAGHMLLRTGWRKGVLMLAVFPITVFKNAIRIVLLTLLSVYVDAGFMKGKLHQMGGIPFFLAALILLGCILWLLKRSESREKPI